jgi:Fungal specific transcription factor domain/Fungal Zn(2)-Cys(6) binuclear cluster domain
MQQPQSHAPPLRTVIRVSSACVQCRGRHLRCDAELPICSRCSKDGTQCTYLKSRRGGRARSTALQSEIQESSSSQQTVQSGPVASVLPADLPEHLECVPALTSDRSQHSGSSSWSSPGAHEQISLSQGTAARESLLDLYYNFFHVSQPCALPRHIMKLKQHDEVPGIKLLVLVMQFIGSLYAPSVSSDQLEEELKAALTERQPYTTVYEVQALLLCAIAMYWCDHLQYADELLGVATSKALALGMNYREFAAENSQGDPVLAESCRRTWWQLYLTDAHIASSNHVTTFRTSQRNVTVTVDLPCEEDDYYSGVSALPLLYSFRYS